MDEHTRRLVDVAAAVREHRIGQLEDWLRDGQGHTAVDLLRAEAMLQLLHQETIMATLLDNFEYGSTGPPPATHVRGTGQPLNRVARRKRRKARSNE